MVTMRRFNITPSWQRATWMMLRHLSKATTNSTKVRGPCSSLHLWQITFQAKRRRRYELALMRNDLRRRSRSFVQPLSVSSSEINTRQLREPIRPQPDATERTIFTTELWRCIVADPVRSFHYLILIRAEEIISQTKTLPNTPERLTIPSVRPS